MAALPGRSWVSLSLSLSLSLYLYIHLSLSLSRFPYRSLSLSMFLSLFISIYLYFSLSLSRLLALSLNLFISLWCEVMRMCDFRIQGASPGFSRKHFGTKCWGPPSEEVVGLVIAQQGMIYMMAYIKHVPPVLRREALCLLDAPILHRSTCLAAQGSSRVGLCYRLGLIGRIGKLSAVGC